MIVPLGGEETLLCCSVPLLPWRSVGGQLEICRLCLNSVWIMIKIIYSVIRIVFVTTIRNQYFIVPSVFECVWQGCFSAKENSLFFMFWLCFVALSVKYWFVLKCNHCSISIVLSSVWVHKYCFPQLNVSQLTFHGVFFMFTVQKRWKTYLWLSVLLLFFFCFVFFLTFIYTALCSEGLG